jgi:FKBP12-rapamycin complex-associated protein
MWQVSTELIRMAILWHEMWHEALEEASRQYFGESNVDAMLATLMPLHELINRQGPTTLKEIAFVQVHVLNTCLDDPLLGIHVDQEI